MASECALVRLADWYKGQCNGAWEHQFGIVIETLDNPGWCIKIDTTLTRTPLDDHPRTSIGTETEADWMAYWIEDETFVGVCGPDRLPHLIAQFFEMRAA